MSKSQSKTGRKVQARIARHKNVRYHNDGYLFDEKQTKNCPVCERPFTNRKKWSKRNQWDSIVYCSRACQKNKSKIA